MTDESTTPGPLDTFGPVVTMVQMFGVKHDTALAQAMTIAGDHDAHIAALEASNARLREATMPDGIVLTLYETWSEEHTRASFHTPFPEIVSTFRDWLAERVTHEYEYDYESDMLTEYRNQEARAALADRQAADPPKEEGELL